MFLIAAEALTPAAPEEAWRLLTDFGRYPLWTRALEIEGAATPGAPLNYSFRIWREDGADRRVTFPGIVDVVEPRHEMRWSLGVPAIFDLRFRFALVPGPGGTVVRHTAEASGLVADTLRGRLERQLGPAVRAFVADAERAFATRPRSAPSPTLPERRP
ncbi:MAG: SRPBCC family protein [Pseudomonadota bacterium]